MTPIDFSAVLGSSTSYNLHSHTQFCDGRDSMEAFARAAVAAGLSVYGFSPHSPVPIESKCNMAFDDVPAYLAEVRRLAALFPSVRFLAGMEIDFLGRDWGPHSPYFRSLPLDYSIGSVHFIPSVDGSRLVDIDGRFESFREKMHVFFNDDIRYVVETFYSQSLLMVHLGGFDIIGHLDKIGHNASRFLPGVESLPWYVDALQALVAEVIRAGVTVEINTKAWLSDSRIFPDPHVVDLLRRAGVPIVVNSDAHYPDRILAGRDHGLSLL